MAVVTNFKPVARIVMPSVARSDLASLIVESLRGVVEIDA